MEAEQFLEKLQPHPAAVHFCTESHIYYVNTPRGPFDIQDGDWVITGIDGVTYPCKHSIFARTYERVD